MRTATLRKIVIVGPPPVQVLDVTSPLEVFSSAPGLDVQLATPGPGDTLRTSRSLTLGGATSIRPPGHPRRSAPFLSRRSTAMSSTLHAATVSGVTIPDTRLARQITPHGAEEELQDLAAGRIGERLKDLFRSHRSMV